LYLENLLNLETFSAKTVNDNEIKEKDSFSGAIFASC